MCDLGEIFRYGNECRVKRGKKPKRLDNWIKSPEILDFIESHEKLTYSNSNSLNFSELDSRTISDFGELNCYKPGTNKYNKTRVDLLLAIKAAATLDKKLEVLIYTIFVTSGILVERDDGGANWKLFCEAVDNYMPGREGKSSNKGIYVNAAKKIREGLGYTDLADWNNALADANIHKKRKEVEQFLTDALENGFITDANHLWKTIENKCKRLNK